MRCIKNTILKNNIIGGKISKNSNNPPIIKALDDICLEIKDGDKIGLLGHNGSGKSTLLRLIAGIYKPDKGSVTTQGQITTLLDSFAGMLPDCTGFENIYLRSYMLGKTKAEIDKKINDIIEFSELGDFIHMPVKRYSSGMYTRLAFSISTAYKPEILLIDEGIGTGDKNFQEKANKRLTSFKQNSRILVFTSHSPDLLRLYCNKIICLKKGKIIDYDSALGSDIIAPHQLNHKNIS